MCCEWQEFHTPACVTTTHSFLQCKASSGFSTLSIVSKSQILLRTKLNFMQQELEFIDVVVECVMYSFFLNKSGGRTTHYARGMHGSDTTP